MNEIPAHLIHYLHEAMTWAETAPEQGMDKPMHIYLTKIAVVYEGDTIGHLVNEDPEWVYQPGGDDADR